MQRVVGTSLVNGLTDIYSEVRALREIHREKLRRHGRARQDLQFYAAGPADRSQVGLCSRACRWSRNCARAAANGVDAEALLPVPFSPQRKALESVLRETTTDGAGKWHCPSAHARHTSDNGRARR